MKFDLLFILFVTFAGLGTAKRVEIYRLNSRHAQAKNFIPVYDSIDDFAESIVEEKPRDANIVLFKTFKSAPVGSQELRNIERSVEDTESSGRTFKHFLLLKSLMGTGSSNNYGSGNGGGFIYPIIINTPLNLTNVNNNTVTNTPAPPADDGGAFAAGGGAGEDVRINLIGLPQMQSWPMQMPMQNMQMPMQNMQMPTEVYHQRKVSQTVPSYTVAMLNIPGNPSFMPIPMSQHLNHNTNRKEQRRVFKWPNLYNANPQNPLTAIANSFGNIQFL